MLEATTQLMVPLGVRALAILLSHLGESAVNNQGAVVEWCCRPLVKDDFWARIYPAGRMEWCAGAVSTCLREAGWSRHGSVDIPSLLVQLTRVEVPQVGDIVGITHGDGVEHVGFLEAVPTAVVSGNSIGHAVARHVYAPEQIAGWWRAE